jgi:hypothetical protein
MWLAALGESIVTSLRADGYSLMKFVRACLCVVALLVVARAAGYVVYVYEHLRTPREVRELESKLVHLAWRVQAGVRLYPPWTDYPHVTNFYSPGYFLVVGLIGSLTGAGLQGLFVIGRVVTVACAVATALVTGWVVRRSDGPRPGIIAAIASLGAAPMFGYALMVRPDTMTEMLGVTGFFLALRPAAGLRIFGMVMLILAMLTKQTAFVFVIAAAAALAVAGQRRQAIIVVVACALGMLAVVGGVTIFEPMFTSSLLGDGKTPWDFGHWTAEMVDLATQAPDLIVVPLLGLSIWLRDRPVRSSPIVLWLAAFGAGALTLAKVGSASNYFLSLRVVEALAIGAVWGAARNPDDQSARRIVAVLLVMAVSLVPGTILAARYARLAWEDARFYPSLEGRRFLIAQRQIIRLAEDPRLKLLTDSGLLQLYQKDRAPFVDPFQFRLMCDTGRIQPRVMLEELEAESYDQLILTYDLDGPDNPPTCGLDRELARAARAHYKLADRRLGLFLYGRRSGRRTGPVGSRHLVPR